MTALEAATALDRDAKRWTLRVGRSGEATRRDTVTFYVTGEVLPAGRRRGARPFFGDAMLDVEVALMSGATAMRRTMREGAA